MTQFVTRVLSPSTEKACSQRAVVAEITDHTNRTRTSFLPVAALVEEVRQAPVVDVPVAVQEVEVVRAAHERSPVVPPESESAR